MCKAFQKIYFSNRIHYNEISLFRQNSPGHTLLETAFPNWIMFLDICILEFSHMFNDAWIVAAMAEVVYEYHIRMKVKWPQWALLPLNPKIIAAMSDLLSVMSIHYNDVIMGSMVSQITSLTIVYSAVYSGADQRKHQSSASLAFVRGIHRGPVNSPHKWPTTREMFPFDDVIMEQRRLNVMWSGYLNMYTHVLGPEIELFNVTCKLRIK